VCAPMARIVLQHRVAWPDVDLVQIVYFARFLSYFELAELEWVRRQGMSYLELLERLGIWMPRVAAHCNYHAPARLDDVLTVEMKLDRLGQTSFTLGYEVFRASDRELLADGYTVIATVSRQNWKPMPVPEGLKEMLRLLKD